MFTFDPLWETMKRKEISIYSLINKHNISRGTIHQLKNDHNVTLSTVSRLCEILDCKIEDVVEYKKDEE